VRPYHSRQAGTVRETGVSTAVGGAALPGLRPQPERDSIRHSPASRPRLAAGRMTRPHTGGRAAVAEERPENLHRVLDDFERELSEQRDYDQDPQI